MAHRLALSFLIFLAFFMMFTGLAARPVLSEETPFYFHNQEELDVSLPQFQIGNFQVSAIDANSSSSSARVFSAASSSQPTANGTAAFMSTQISVSGQQSGYVAVVAWVTNPFPANVTLEGDVIMHIWMSSNAPLNLLQGSEFFMEVADYSPTSSSPFQLPDDFMSNATFGNALSNSPTEYVDTMRIDQYQFVQGDMIMFFAGAGSDTQGYTFTIYFDSPTWDSRAEIPADPTLTVPEFPNLMPAILATLLFPLIVVNIAIRRT